MRKNFVPGKSLDYVRVGNLLIGFSSDSLVFCEQKSNSLVKKSESLLSLFCHKRWEQIVHSFSFVKSDGSYSLTVALLSRAMRVNSSHRSLKKSNWAKRDGSNLLLGIKRGNIVKNCQKLNKKIYIIFFWSKLLVFESDLLESQTNHSPNFFLFQ